MDLAPVAGGTEPAAFAGKSQKVFVAAVVATNAGEATFESAAVDEYFHDLLNHRAQGAVIELVGAGVTGHEGGVVPLGALPER